MAEKHRNNDEHHEYHEQQGHNHQERHVHVNEDDRPMREFSSSHASFTPYSFYATPIFLILKPIYLSSQVYQRKMLTSTS